MSGQSAVLSAIGAPISRAATSVHADSAHSIVAARWGVGVRRSYRLNFLAPLNPQHDPDLNLFFEHLFKRIFPNIYQDQMEMEKIVMASDTDWTIVRPAALMDGPATGPCLAAEAYAIRGGNQTPH